MSPFEETAERVAERIRSLNLQAQVGLFAVAGEALTASYDKWARSAGRSVVDDDLRRGIHLAKQFVIGVSSSEGARVLASLEAGTPSEPTDVEFFTAAQDCWICVDTAVRAMLGDFDPASSAWYLLEPQYQSTSERLFGLSDVGSEKQAEAEELALEDDRLATAIAAIETVVTVFEAGAVDLLGLEVLAELLDPLNPE